LRALGLIIFPVALIAAPALAAEPLPDAGSAKLAAYQVCHPLAVIDMGAEGSESATECNGVVRNMDPQKAPDNLAIRCLESTSARPDHYRYWGTCVQTDSDGDKLLLTYDGVKNGQFKWIGGTGKYKDIDGSGSLNVVVAPNAGATGLFAYTLNFDATWSKKAK
jgi:hypothetical protein